MLKTAIDRRALLTGRGLVVDPVVTPPGGEIASVLVQVRPERIEEVASAIASPCASFTVPVMEPVGTCAVTPIANTVSTAATRKPCTAFQSANWLSLCPATICRTPNIVLDSVFTMFLSEHFFRLHQLGRSLAT